MQAIRVHETGGPDAMRLEEIGLPEPGPGEVRIRMAASGVNFIDVYQRTGMYKLPTPFTPGMEGAGTVDAVGPGVDDVASGDRVAWAMRPGSYAEYAVVGADALVRVPEDVELETAAAVMLQGMTAHYLSSSTFPLEPGHVAVVHAAAGGVGLLLTQLAKRRGATVVATTSSPEKAALARQAGADVAVDYDDFVDEVERHGGAHVVYDGIGKTTFDRGLECLRIRGTFVLYGQSSGKPDPLDPQRLNSGGSLFLTRPTLAHYSADPAERAWRAGELFELIASGELDVRLDRTHPLAEAPTAHARLEGRETTGKVLLVP